MTVYCYPLFAINILNIYLFIFFILFRFLIFESCTAEFRKAKLEIRFPFWYGDKSVLGRFIVAFFD